MSRIPALVATAALALAVPAAAGGVQTASTPAARPPAPAAAALAAEIRRAFVDARDRAQREGLSGEALELAVSAAVEAVIAGSGADPQTVLEALRLALAEEQCVLEADGQWNRLGCAALGRLAAAIAATLEGPAAGGGGGDVAVGPVTPPPGVGGGPDYDDN